MRNFTSLIRGVVNFSARSIPFTLFLETRLIKINKHLRTPAPSLLSSRVGVNNCACAYVAGDDHFQISAFRFPLSVPAFRFSFPFPPFPLALVQLLCRPHGQRDGWNDVFHWCYKSCAHSWWRDLY